MNKENQDKGGAQDQQPSAASSLISSALGGLMPQNSLDDILKQAKEIAPQQQQQQQQQQQASPSGDAAAQAATQAAAGQSAKPTGDGTDEPGTDKGQSNAGQGADKGGDNKLSFLKSKASDQPAAGFEIPDQAITPEIAQFIEKKYGIKDPKTFFESTDKWRNSSQEVTKAKEEVSMFNKLFEQMPEPLYAAIESFLKNEDWTKAVNSRPLHVDFSKDLKDFDTKTLLGIYNPGDFSDEDFEIASQDPNSAQAKAIKFAYENASVKYSQQKDYFKNKRANDEKAAKQYRDLVESSASGSVEKLKQTLPDVADTVLSEIQTSLVSGGFDSYFRNNDGSLNDNAAKFMLFIKYGDEIMSMMTNKAVVEASNAAKAEVISRTNENVVVQDRGNGAAGGGQDRVNAFLNRALPKNSNSTY